MTEIRKHLLTLYPGAVFYGLLFNISLMIDSILAGWALGAEGIAAVALGVPGCGLFAAAVYALIHGSGLRMIWTKGGADNAGFHRAFCGGATLVALSGLIFAAIILLFAEPLVLLCGGDMVEASTRGRAVMYLQFCAPVVFLTALGIIPQEVMNVLGYQTARAALTVINVGVNLLVSVLCVLFLPAEMKLAGLGIGTSAAGLAELIGGLVILRVLKVRLGYRPLLPRPREIGQIIRSGFPAAADYFAENLVMGVQNNLILTGFPGDALILPTVEVVCNIAYFASGAVKGAALAAEPLFGVYYVERDVRGLKRVWRQGWGLGVIMSVVWAALFYLALPALSALCGMALTEDIRRGILLCLVFAPVMHTVYMLTLYYEATQRFALSMAFSIIPDSLLSVVMMAVLIPVLGKDGIWLSVTGNQVLGLALLLPLVLLLRPKTGKGLERLLLLPEDFYTGTLLESEIAGPAADAAKLEPLRASLGRSLGDTVRTEAVLGCVGELMFHMRRAFPNIHMRLRDGEDGTELFFRGFGQPWDLPESIAENELFRKGDASVSCTYVYKMNIVRVTLGRGA